MSFIALVMGSNLSCGPSSDQKPGDIDLLNDYRESSCKFDYSTGEGVETYPEEISTVHFDKKFERHHFRAVAFASGEKTIDYVQRVGDLKVWRANASTGGCSFFGSLGSAPSNFKDLWNKYAGSIKGGSLLGLYLSKNYHEVPGHQPTIMLRDDSDRWTIVHEFLHHLFEMYREKDGQPTAEIYSAFQKNVVKLKALADSPSNLPASLKKQRLLELIASLTSHFDYKIHFLTDTALEEMTIETLMMNEFRKFKYLAKNFKYSITYVIYSSKNAEKSLEEDISAAEGILSKLRSDSETASLGLDVSGLQNVIDKLNRHLYQMRDAKRDARDAYYQGTGQRTYDLLVGNVLAVPKFDFMETAPVMHAPNPLWEEVQRIKLPEIKLLNY